MGADQYRLCTPRPPVILTVPHDEKVESDSHRIFFYRNTYILLFSLSKIFRLSLALKLEYHFLFAERYNSISFGDCNTFKDKFLIEKQIPLKPLIYGLEGH